MTKPKRVQPPTLTEDDLALAWFACGLVSAFWRDWKWRHMLNV